MAKGERHGHNPLIPPGMRYIDRFYDTNLEVDEAWTYEQEESDQQDRLLLQAEMGCHIAVLKRRLGGDASPIEMRLDKRRGRMLASRSMNCLQNWGGKPVKVSEQYELDRVTFPTPEILITATQLNWNEFWLSHRVYLQNEARRVGTHAMRIATKKHANRLVYRLEYEYNQLADFLGTVLGDEPSPFRFDPETDTMETDKPK